MRGRWLLGGGGGWGRDALFGAVWLMGGEVWFYFGGEVEGGMVGVVMFRNVGGVLGIRVY